MSNKPAKKRSPHKGQKDARQGHTPRHAPKRPQHRKNNAAGGELWLYGIHAVQAALANPKRRCERLMGTGGALDRLDLGIAFDGKTDCIDAVERADIDALLGDESVHQGLALQASPLPDVDIIDVLKGINENEPALFVALDQVTDPHNVGAVLRSAAAFGAHVMLTTRHNAPDETGVLAKAASGALEAIPIVRVTNLKRSLKECQEFGFWSVGLDATSEVDIGSMDMPARCVLVLGAEGKGMRLTVQEMCDFVARLPMSGPMKSLNVSNAAAISMYEWQRQQGAS